MPEDYGALLTLQRAKFKSQLTLMSVYSRVEGWERNK